MSGLALILLYNVLVIPTNGHISSDDSLITWDDPGPKETALSPVFAEYTKPSIPLIVGT